MVTPAMQNGTGTLPGAPCPRCGATQAPYAVPELDGSAVLRCRVCQRLMGIRPVPVPEA
jgi:hypothetical protein